MCKNTIDLSSSLRLLSRTSVPITSSLGKLFRRKGMPPTTHQTCEALLADMVGFDTVNGSISGIVDAEVELARYLEAVAGEMGFATQRLPLEGESFNLLVSHEVDERAPWLMFESHMDTVTVEGMTIEPFKAEFRDGRIYGRGACDTKGTGAAMLWALKKYAAAARSRGGNNVAIVFTTDEEVGKSGVRSLARRQMSTFGWRPTGVVVGEPTMLRPIVAHNGVARWKIVTHGVAAHSSNPHKGKSAISMMMMVVDLIEQRYAPSLTASHALTGKAQCTVNVIRGGSQVNVIPARCEIEIDRRVVPGEDGATVAPAVEALLDGLRQQDANLVVEQEAPFIDPPLDPTGGEAFAAIVQGALADMNLPTELEGVQYGTDASQFGQIGIPVVVLGPGNIGQAHTKDEWLSLEQLHLGIDVCRRLMQTDLKGIT